MEHSGTFSQKLPPTDYIAKAQELIRTLGEENLKKKKSFLPERKEKMEERLISLFQDRQKIIDTPPELKKHVCKRIEDKGETNAYSYERTDTGAYGLIGHVIGQGTYKKAKIAIELISERLFVRTTAPRIYDESDHFDILKDLKREFKLQTLFTGEKEIVQILHSYLSPSKKGFLKRVTIMEFCNAGDLEGLLKKFKLMNALSDLEQTQLIIIFHDILLGLVKIGEKGVIHRDIKPSNIFLNIDEEGRMQGKIGDFGLSIIKENEVEAAGTLMYMSPERILKMFGDDPPYYYKTKTITNKEMDSRRKCDLWSVGIMMYEALYKSHIYNDYNLNVPLKSIGELVYIAESMSQNQIARLCVSKKFQNPFEQSFQEILAKILIIDPQTRPDVKCIYQLYCKNFDLPSKIK